MVRDPLQVAVYYAFLLAIDYKLTLSMTLVIPIVVYVMSIIGRYYAMDRDHRWPRIQAAYDLITLGKAEYQAEDGESALQMAYERGETDEFDYQQALKSQTQPL